MQYEKFKSSANKELILDILVDYVLLKMFIEI